MDDKRDKISGVRKRSARVQRKQKKDRRASDRSNDRPRLGPGGSLSGAMIFAWVSILQSLLIYFQHYTPFQRVANLESVLMGARTAMVVWLVAAIDLFSFILLGRLVMASIPATTTSRRWRSTLTGLPIAFLGVAWMEYAIVMLMESAPGEGIAVGEGLLAFGAGLAGASAVAFLVAQATHEGSGGDSRSLMSSFFRILPAAILLGPLTFILRRQSFFLQAVPLIGMLMRAAFDVWVVCRLVRILSWFARPPAKLESPAPARNASALLAGFVSFFLAGFTIAFSSLPKHLDAYGPPPIIPREAPIAFKSETRGDKVVGSSRRMRVVIDEDPFGFAVLDQDNKILARLFTDGEAPDAIRGVSLYKELSEIHTVPFLDPGRLLKSRLRLMSDALDEAFLDTRPKNSNKPLMARGKAGDTPMGVSFSFIDNHILKVSVEAAPTPWHTIAVSLACADDERFIGLGSGSASLDRRGMARDLIVEDKGARARRATGLASILGLGRMRVSYGADESYWPTPFILFSRGVGVFVAGANEPRIEVATERDGVVTFSGRGGVLHLYVIAGANSQEILARFARLTGRRPVPPPSAMPPWSVAEGPPGLEAAAVATEAHRLREIGAPCQYIRYRGRAVDPGGDGLPRGLSAAIKRGRERGFRFSFDDVAWLGRGSTRYFEAVRNGYLVTNRLGLPYHVPTRQGTRVLIDFTNPDAVGWRGEDWQKIKATGFTAVFLDPAGVVPPDSVLYNGQSGVEARNLYPLIYARALSRGLGRDFMICSSFGFSGMERFVSMAWPLLPGVEGAGADRAGPVIGMLNMSLSSAPPTGSGVSLGPGRGTGRVDALSAMAALGAGSMSPLMVLPHGALGDAPPAALMDLSRRLAEDHMRLIPYIYSLVVRASRGGPPVILSPGLDHPGQPGLYDLRDQYLLGESLMVALPDQVGKGSRDVLLPPGRWLHLDSLLMYDGGEQSVSFRGGRPILFLAEGGLLPLFDQAFHTFSRAEGVEARTGRLDADMTVLWITGEPAALTLFDGARMSARGAGESILIRVGGGAKRYYSFRLFDCPRPAAAFANGIRLDASDVEYLQTARVLTLPPLPGPGLNLEVLIRRSR